MKIRNSRTKAVLFILSIALGMFAIASMFQNTNIDAADAKLSINSIVRNSQMKASVFSKSKKQETIYNIFNYEERDCTIILYVRDDNGKIKKYYRSILENDVDIWIESEEVKVTSEF